MILAICTLVRCASNENVVSVRQADSDEPVVLRMRKDRTFIHSLLYPITFEFKKNDNRDIYYGENSYYAKNEEICLGTAGCFYGKKMMDEHKDTIHVPLKEFNSNFRYIIDNFFEGDSIYLHFHDHKRWQTFR